MLRKFFSRFFREEEPEEIRLNMEKLKDKIIDLKNKEENIISAEGKKIVKDMQTNINKVRHVLKIIKEREITKEDKRAYDITKSSREILVTHISSALNKITLPENITYNTLLSLNNSLNNFFMEISRSAKNFFYTSLKFGDQTGELKEILRKIDNRNKCLSNIIDSKNNKILNEIYEKINQIEDYENKVESFKNQIKVTEKKILEQKQKAEDLKEDMKILKNSKEYKDFLENDKKIFLLKENIEENEMKIRTFVSPLVKSLKKSEKILEDKKKKKEIAFLISEPIEFLSNNYSKAKNIFLELEKMILRDDIYLDPKEKEKKLIKINEIKEGFLLKLLEERKKQENNLDSCSKIEFPVLRKISETERGIAALKIDSLPEDNTEDINKNILSEKRNIEKLCQEIGKNIVLE